METVLNRPRITSPAWMRRASCIVGIRLGIMQPDDWYPEWGQKNSPRSQLAVRVCQACPVRRKCLEYALASDERWGIWGGMNNDEITRLRRKRAQKVDPAGS